MKLKHWLVFPVLFVAAGLNAQISQPPPKVQSAPPVQAPQAAPANSMVLEEIVARVNNDVITREDMAHSRETIVGEAQDECQRCTPDQLKEHIAEKDKNVLRDLIDQSLLVQRAKDDGISVDTDVIKRLDAIRIEYKLPSMEALEAEVTKSGQDYEEFKSHLKDQLLTQELIRKEVGSRIIISHEDVVKFYNEHKSSFVRPETVVLREIFVSTEGKPDADIPALRKKADGLRDRVLKNGDDFGEMAKHFSDSNTAQQSGELGVFERSQLDSKIADKVFALNRNQMTDVIETKTGFEILQVVERYDAGEQPLEKVEPEITNRLYEQQMAPGLRAYLATLRQDSYVQIKPGYVDTAAEKSEPITEVAATPDKDDTKKEVEPQVRYTSEKEFWHMKQSFIANLQDGQNITSHFLVCEKEIRATREGKSYLRLELGDATGRVEARMWEGFDRFPFERDDFVKVQARVENYRNKLQLAIEKIRRVEESEVDAADFFPHTKENVDQLYAKLLEFAASVGNPWLRQLLDNVVQDTEIVSRLKRAPAAKTMHHAFFGGLLEHVISLCGLCRVVLAHYPEADYDLLLTGAILHDIGKLEELSYERSIGYTDEGQLLGHILIEYESVAKKIDLIEGFPPALKTLVQHMLVAHHGRYEFGSPKLPMFREALMLHYLDDLDSKMGAVRLALESDKGEGNWTAYSGALERRILRTDKFLSSSTAETSEAAAKSATANGSADGGKLPGGKE